MKNNVIIFKKNPLYIKKIVKDKTLNLFGAPIPKDTLIKYYDKFEKYFKLRNQYHNHKNWLLQDY